MSSRRKFKPGTLVVLTVKPYSLGLILHHEPWSDWYDVLWNDHLGLSQLHHKELDSMTKVIG